MTWYEWVWAVTATLALLLLIACGVLGVVYLSLRSKRREHVAELEADLRYYRTHYESLKNTHAMVKKQLDEERKERNQYGRIIP